MVTVGGQFLNGATNVQVSRTGVQAKILEVTRPMSNQEAMDMREKLQEMGQRKAAAYRRFGGGNGRGRPFYEAGGARGEAESGITSTNKTAPWTPADDKVFEDMRKKLANFVPPNQLIPALSDSVTLRVTVSPEAEPGDRELRIGSGFGLSNPLRFCIGQLPEFSKPLARIIVDRRNSAPDMKPATPKSEMNITLPATINGQIMPGGVDQYRFHARKGQPLVIIANARELVPYLPDAVPGWFQAALTLFDAKGKELAFDDDFRFHPDPVLYYQIPEDGYYSVAIRDSVYRGRQDFVYRVSLGELPFVTSIFPLGGTVGTETTVELKGWNLPITNLTMTVKTPGVTQTSVRRGELISNHVPFAADELPECLEQEPNDQQANAQRVTLPIIINGRIGKPGETDMFRFVGRAGDQIVAEVYARRLDSPLDSVLRLTDANKVQIAYNDDHEDKGSGLNTHHADSYLSLTLPTNGTYYLHLSDTQRKGGSEYAYRLRISAPRPDYALRVAPSSLSVRGGTTMPITVYALRKDGFSNEIALLLKDAPPGFMLNGNLIPVNTDVVRLTLTAASFPATETIKLQMVGRAIVQGQALVHPAVPAEEMMQAFAYWHLVPMTEMDVAVLRSRFMTRPQAKISSQTPVKIPVGGTARVQVDLATSTSFGNIDLELSEPPEGITIEKFSSSRGGTEIVLHSDAKKVKLGLKGNLIVNSFFVAKPGGIADKSKKKLDKRFTSLGSLPAIPFEVVAR